MEGSALPGRSFVAAMYEDNGAVLTPLVKTGTLQGHGATLAGVQGNAVIISGVRRLCRCVPGQPAGVTAFAPVH